MKYRRKGSIGFLRMKVFSAAMLLTMTLCAGLGWEIWDSYNGLRHFENKDKRLQELSGIITYYDEVLTMSVRMAAATSNLDWEDRYRNFELKLDVAIKEAISLTPETFATEAPARIDSANIELVAMENRAFDLVRGGHAEDALALLFSGKYKEQKQIYSEGMSQVTMALQEHVNASLQEQREQTLFFVASVVVALPSLLLVWIGVLGVVRRDNARRELAERALQENLDQLERRVEERTSEIAEAKEKLEMELVQRRRVEETLRHKTHDLGERVKKLNCFYEISNLVEEKDVPLEGLLQEIVDIIPPAWHYPEITCARIILGDQEYKTENFRETIWKQSSDINWGNGETCIVQICYLVEKPELDEGPFLKEERDMIEAIARQLEEIIEHKRTAAELCESEEKFRVISTSATDAIVMMDESGNVAYWNPSAEEMFGYSSEEVIGKNLHKALVPAEYHEKALQGIREFKRTGEGAAIGSILELTALRKDGSEFPVELSVSQIRVNGGWRAVGIIRDITERKKAEEFLRESEEKFRKIFESSNDAMMLLDEKGFFDCNESTLRIFDYSTREEFCGKHPGEVSPPTQPAGKDSGKAANERIAEAFRTGRNFFEWMYRRADGEDFPAEELLTPMELEGRQVLQATVRDITEHRQLEEQLRQAQKMETIGQLAAGIAHDFNNLLTGILGYISFAMTEIDENDPTYGDLEEARQCAQRAATLTSRLLAFGRKQPLKLVTEDLNVIVRESTCMLKPAIGEHIELQLGLAPEQITIRVDQSQIEQVITNICVNARDAMPQGGTLLLRTSTMTADKAFCASRPDLQPGRYAILRITDNGTGMDEKSVERIFDPFFTTKEVGKGTGLGLSMAHGIMRQHKGQIYVRSKPGEGSTFELYFPAAQAESDHERKIEDKAQVLQNGNGTILLAEDEQVVRDLVLDTLKLEGYSVLTAENGEDALRVIEADKGRISLAILDMMMPKKGGFEVSETIRAIRPDIKILFMSGNSLDALDETFKGDPASEFVMKPFNPAEIAQKVAGMLNSKESENRHGMPGSRMTNSEPAQKR